MVKMISLLVSEITESSKFTETITKLTETHNTRGVKAIECEYICLVSDNGR